MGTLQRIKQYIDFKGITIKLFEESVGFSNGAFGSQLRNNRTIGVDKIENILSVYQDLSPEWLLTGKGKMLLTDLDSNTMIHRFHSQSGDEELGDIKVPLYNIEIASNLRSIFDNRDLHIIDTLQIPNLPQCDGAIYIKGDDMYPLLNAGDIVIYKEIYDYSHLIYGEIYLIEYVIGNIDYLMVRYVRRSDQTEFINLVSNNPKYDPIDVSINSIRTMALVKANIRMNTII